MTLNRCATNLTRLAALALRAGSIGRASLAQVVAPAEFKDPKLRVLQSNHQAQPTAAAEMAGHPVTIAQRPAVPTPAPVVEPPPPPKKEVLDRRPTGLQHRMVQEPGPQANFDPLARPELIAFRGGPYLRIPVVTTLGATDVGSQYRVRRRRSTGMPLIRCDWCSRISKASRDSTASRSAPP